MKKTIANEAESNASDDADLWQDSDLARRIAAAEAPVWRDLCVDLFGYQMLQVGFQPHLVSGLETCVIRRKVVVVPSTALATDGALVADPRALPVQSDSIDSVIIPHTLDFSIDPRQVLREIERVLIPEGRILISGFNPLSLWGARRVIRKTRNSQPWKAHFISSRRLQDWLSLLGFDVEQVHFRMYRPPLRQSTLMHSLRGLERVGQRFWPWAGATYMVRAVKRVSTLTPVGLSWRMDKKLGNQVAEPTGGTGYGNVIPFRGRK